MFCVLCVFFKLRGHVISVPNWAFNYSHHWLNEEAAHYSSQLDFVLF